MKVGRLTAVAALVAFIACAAGDSPVSGKGQGPVELQAAIAPEDVTFTTSCKGVLCTFEATSSTNTGSVVTWVWDWGDGTTVTRTTPIAKKIFASPGIYNVTLTITNAGGQSASATKPDTLLAEPVGMTKVTETGFNCVTGCDEWPWFDQLYPGAASVVPDPTAPKSPPAVVWQNFTSLLPGGSSPGSFGLKLSQYQTIYVAIWMKLSENYQGHGSGVNKVLHFFTRPGTGGSNVAIFNIRGSGNGTLVPAFLMQALAMTPGEINLDASPSVCRTERGRWTRYEMVLRNNTPGMSDGSATLWMDGVKCIERAGLAFVREGQINKWSEIWWSPTWGGVGDRILSPFYEAVDHIYISGK
jgi:hypothetical protein